MSPSPNLLALAGLGLLLGFRHAFEPDHLAAVSTLATRQGRLLDACRLGLAWALGHPALAGIRPAARARGERGDPGAARRSGPHPRGPARLLPVVCGGNDDRDARGVGLARERGAARLDAGRALGERAPRGQRAGERRGGAGLGRPGRRGVLATVHAPAVRLAHFALTARLPGCLRSGGRRAVHAARGLPGLVDGDRKLRWTLG